VQIYGIAMIRNPRKSIRSGNICEWRWTRWTFFFRAVTMRYFAAIARAQGPRQCAATCLPRERRPINRMSLIRGMFCVTGWQTDHSAQTRLFLLTGLNRIFSRITGTETKDCRQSTLWTFLPSSLVFAHTRKFTSRIHFWNFAFLWRSQVPQTNLANRRINEPKLHRNKRRKRARLVASFLLCFTRGTNTNSCREINDSSSPSSQQGLSFILFIVIIK
jgi:hypothetical protein